MNTELDPDNGISNRRQIKQEGPGHSLLVRTLTFLSTLGFDVSPVSLDPIQWPITVAVSFTCLKIGLKLSTDNPV